MRHAIYRELGVAPGIPTMKGSYGDPENTGVGYNTIIKELGDTYLSSGMGVGLGIVSFETRNTRSETTQKIENADALPSFMPKYENVTKEERETKLSVGATTPVVTLAETGFHKKQTITYKNAKFSKGKIVKGNITNNTKSKGFYYDSVTKHNVYTKNYNKRDKTEVRAKCILGLSFEIDFKGIFNKVTSFFSK